MARTLLICILASGAIAGLALGGTEVPPRRCCSPDEAVGTSANYATVNSGSVDAGTVVTSCMVASGATESVIGLAGSGLRGINFNSGNCGSLPGNAPAIYFNGTLLVLNNSSGILVQPGSGQVFDVGGGGGFRTSGRHTYTPDADTIADDGAGTNAAHTLTPSSAVVTLTCSDTQGCDITMSESGAVAGMIVTIVSLSGSGGAGENNFADSAGVLELAGGSALAAETNDVLKLLYTGSAWVEVGRANN